MATTELNKWEKLFLDFLEMTEFYPLRRVDENGVDCFGLENGQHANLGDIESDFFYSATDILDRLTVYEYDYIIRDLKDCADFELEHNEWTDLLKYRPQMPNNQYNFDLIEMICNHPQDIDINKVFCYLESS